jgi:hypothetical protein
LKQPGVAPEIVDRRLETSNCSRILATLSLEPLAAAIVADS